MKDLIRSKEEFDFVANDKKLHFLAGAEIYFKCYPFIWKVSYLIVALAAALKEARDWLGYGTPEVADFWWTIYGAATADKYVTNKDEFRKLYARK